MFKYDKKAVFSFASLQSDTAKRLLHDAELTDVPDSVIVIKNGEALVKSDAALYIVKQLGGFFSLFLVLRLLPLRLRDKIYDGIAKRRYKWFGENESCMIPSKKQKERFL